ncbi:uncharacterized protein [Periplaneta americana]|uniref:uncharacterized protein n=1 Tax=Periplaneta americana TaxID=6978 RepID=UPI0037E7767B
MSSCVHWAIFLLATFSSGWQLTQSGFQPDNVGETYEFANEGDISCTRECTKDSLPRLCHYQFSLENYNTLSLACQNCTRNISQCYNPQCVAADGYKRGILTVNRMLPGPSIQVCYGDKIVVDVKNKMPSQSTTIHWHGIFQRGTPFYDGVPMITQCHIDEGTTFRYQFYANQPGTFYWHSHDGIQKSDGLQGSLVVRRARDHEPNAQLYDYDLPAHVIMISDWSHRPAIDHFPGLVVPVTYTYGVFFLINGRGRYTDPVEGNITTPYSVFRVHPGKRYRFRVIGAICIHCPALLSIDGHNLTIIDTDGNAVKPVEVQALHLHSGERYDFVLNATNEVNSYWIRVKGMGKCAPDETAQQRAVLQYQGAEDTEPREHEFKDEDEKLSPDVKIMNPQNATCSHGEHGVCVSQLEAAEPIDENILKPEPDVNITILSDYVFPKKKDLFYSGSFNRFDHPDDLDLIYTLNNITNEDTSSPLLTQLDDIPPGQICPTGVDGRPYCNTTLCTCSHIIKVPLGDVVQFILIDGSSRAGMNHPFHLHGYAFNVMAMGYLEDTEMNADNIAILLKSNKLQESSAPALKDTIAVPSSGYAVLRILADNPGFWLFHCHYLDHHVVGMAFILQVGDPQQYPPVPAGFPKCGDFKPLEGL